jgi:hypothetical protein
MFILLFIIFIAGIMPGLCKDAGARKTPKRGTREGVRAIHGMRKHRSEELA